MIVVIFEISVDPEYGIYAEVNLVVDATNVPDVNASIEDFGDATGSEWSVDMQSLFITSIPSAFPTLIPSLTPSTPIPSATPSITGLVVIIDVTFSKYVSETFA